MKINPNPAVIQAMQTYHKNRTAPAKKSDEMTHVQDKMDLSPKAMEFQTALRALRDVPDIRQDRVDEVKAKMAEGKLATPQEVAERMLRNINQRSQF